MEDSEFYESVERHSVDFDVRKKMKFSPSATKYLTYASQLQTDDNLVLH